MIRVFSLVCLAFSTASSPALEPAPFAVELSTIQSIGKEGTGNAEAAKAWDKVVAGGANALFPTLRAFHLADPTAANWLRTAIDAIAEGEKKAGRKLDATKLSTFVRDSENHPTARRIAYELLNDQEPTAAKTLLAKFTEDPSLELRRDAIALNLATAKDVPALQKLFAAARDKDQVEAIAKKLADEKTPANISKHYGYITEWHAVGPFSNAKSEGFGVANEPEKGIDLAANYAGSHTKEKKSWKYAQSEAKYGTVDLNAVLGKHMDCTGYAAATIVAEKETAAEIRVASQNAIKIFVNGAEVFAREEYHHGTSMDQHKAKITLKKGSNTILLKLCQNDTTQSWAQAWNFAARVCDATGGALPVKQLINDKTTDLGELKPAAKKE